MTRARSRQKATTALVPAAARVPDTLDEAEALLNTEAIEVFAKAVGGRDGLTHALAIAGAGAGVEKITTLLLDPRYASWSLSRLCNLVGLTVADLFASYRKALVARSHIQATHIIASRLPPIVEDVMTRAAPQTRVCPACAGASVAGSCPACGGTGAVQTEPELDRQKLALELGQLLEKKGGIVVQQNNQTAMVTATQAGSLEQLQQAVGDLLFGGSRAQGDGDDGETIDAPAELPDLPDEPGDDPPGLLDPSDAADVD